MNIDFSYEFNGVNYDYKYKLAKPESFLYTLKARKCSEPFTPSLEFGIRSDNSSHSLTMVYSDQIRANIHFLGSGDCEFVNLKVQKGGQESVTHDSHDVSLRNRIFVTQTRVILHWNTLRDTLDDELPKKYHALRRLDKISPSMEIRKQEDTFDSYSDHNKLIRYFILQ